jgi:hypothetical protein
MHCALPLVAAASASATVRTASLVAVFFILLNRFSVLLLIFLGKIKYLYVIDEIFMEIKCI